MGALRGSAIAPGDWVMARLDRGWTDEVQVETLHRSTLEVKTTDGTRHNIPRADVIERTWSIKAYRATLPPGTRGT
jgi:hypothetical protein